MIVVAGFNSAIDTCADAATVRAGDVVRLSHVARYPGGKGVHVAQTCARLGAAVRLVGLIDEEHAPLFDRVLDERRVEFHGVFTTGRLRTCYAIRDAQGIVTELLEPSETIAPAVVAQLDDAVAQASDVSSASKVIVMSGSLPDGCAPDTYARLVRRARRRDGIEHVIVDTSGVALEAAIEPGDDSGDNANDADAVDTCATATAMSCLPTLIKPNRDEAARLVGHVIETMADAFEAARTIAARGICRVVISLGDEGAAVCWDGRLARLDVPRQIAVSAVGSGDCFVGGLAVAIARGESADDTLKLAGACGAANVLTREPGWFAPADVERLARVVRVTWL